MTTVEVAFTYGGRPNETNMQAIDGIREVYGIRKIRFNEAESTVRIEYDATRLNEDAIASLLRRAGIDVRERLSLT